MLITLLIGLIWFHTVCNIRHKNVKYLTQKCCLHYNTNKLDHDNINSRHLQNLDKFFKRVLKILSGREKNMMDERMDGRNDRQPKSYRPPPFSKWGYNNTYHVSKHYEH